MFGVYLATRGVSPKEHPVKQELESIRVYMNRVKEITGKKKTSKLDSGAALRFVKKISSGIQNLIMHPKLPIKEKVKINLSVLTYTY